MVTFESTRVAEHRSGRLSLTSLSVAQPIGQSFELISSDVNETLQHACVHWPWIAAARSALQEGHCVLKEAGLQQLCPESWKVSMHLLVKCCCCSV